MPASHHQSGERYDKVSSDFATLGRSARAAIPVPEVPMAAIRGRVRRSRGRDRSVRLVLCGALCLAALGIGVELGDRAYEGVRVWLLGGKEVVAVRSVAFLRNPMAFEVRAVASTAAFPVIFPVGLPANSQLRSLVVAPAEHPTFIQVGYRLPNRYPLNVQLVDAVSVATDAAALSKVSHTRLFGVYQWRVGDEIVLVGRGVSRSIVARVRSQMMRTSPRQSLSETEGAALGFVVLGYPTAFSDIARRYVPPGSRAVLLDSWHVKALSMSAQRKKPLFDDRTVYIHLAPSASGTPDWSSARPRWKRVMAISAPGVQGVEAVLRYAYGGRTCSCEILFDQRSRGAYWVWTIANAPPHLVQRYTVDATTLAIVPST